MSDLRSGRPASITFEMCAEALDAVLTGAAGGAHRIELCAALEVGGLTPPVALVRSAVAQCPVPVHVLIRPQAESFVYSPARFAAIERSLLEMKQLGVAGFVLGILTGDGRVDVEHTRRLVSMAAPLPVTFHRAFDETADLPRALDDVMAAGCKRVLTSGGAADVLTGASVLAELVSQGAGRIDVAVGGGLRLGNARAVAALTGGSHFHASLREPEDGGEAEDGGERDAGESLLRRVRDVIRLLEEGSAAGDGGEPEEGYTTAGTGIAASGSRAGRWP